MYFKRTQVKTVVIETFSLIEIRLAWINIIDANKTNKINVPFPNKPELIYDKIFKVKNK